MRIRVVIAGSVLWILIALGIICYEYLFRDPLAKHYFWTMPSGGIDLFATPEQLLQKLQPRMAQIAFLMFGPVVAFWVLGWLAAWTKRGETSRTDVREQENDARRPNAKYPWGSVITWVAGAFLAGLVLVRAPHDSSVASAVALKIIGGATLALFVGIAVGVYKIFRR